MYSEWASLHEEIECHKGNQSVLHKFNPAVGRDVACTVVKHIAANVSMAASSEEPSNLEDEKDVKWTMEVLCFGLGLPLMEHETINECVKVYCEWLTALLTPRACVPKPIVADPNPFAQTMLHHLLNLFKPRPGSGLDLVNKQAVLCHRVLRTIETIAKESSILTRATWETLLKFLLAANDSLLSPPTEKDDIGDNLCERVLSVLFGVWLLACAKSFPSPSLWKTFRCMTQNWRHHEGLVSQWHRVNHALTSHLIKMMYGPAYPELHVSEEDAQMIPVEISGECIAQSWFRFLHILQNPVHLCKPDVISNTPKFLQHTIVSTSVVNPSQHECLQKLPQIFFKAMRGVSVMVNAFLGLPQSVKEDNLMAAGTSMGKPTSTTPSTPPNQRKSTRPIAALAGSLTQRGHSSPTSRHSKLLSPSPSLSPTPVSPPRRKKMGFGSPTPHSPQSPVFGSQPNLTHSSRAVSPGRRKAARPTSLLGGPLTAWGPFSPPPMPSPSVLLSPTEAYATAPAQLKGGRSCVVNSGPFSQKVGSSKAHSNVPKMAPPPTITLGRLSLDNRCPFASARPRCNSVLHLFGAWLFDAALAGVKLFSSHEAKSERRTSSFIETKHGSVSAENWDHQVMADNTYEHGRAEALGTLCRIFCAHKTGEEILPVYYSRFYLVMVYGLLTEESRISGQVLSNMLFNSCDLLRVDLAGVQILLPYILDAIDLVLSKTTPDFKLSEQIPYVELRKACIHLLLSALCLPLHFKDLEIKDIMVSGDSPGRGLTFLSLKTRIIDMLQRAVTNETDAANTQMLLGGLMLVVQDLATCEEAEQMNCQAQECATDSDAQPEPSRDPSRASVSTTSTDSSVPEAPYQRLSQPAKDVDTAYGLFGHATSLVCNRLMASWKSDLNSALAAMELLAGLAKVSIRPPNVLMCKRTVKWICDFVVYQCSRPAPLHSRDLHSMIVAAFKCLQLWLVEHSVLLYDKECLHYVLEVVELGISGSKSQAKTSETQTVKVKIEKDSKSQTMKNRASDPPKFKGDKVLMPASMRVKDAAEAVLACIIDQVGAFPPPCGPESLFSLLDEQSLLKFAKGSGLPEQGTPFRYFVIDNSIIIGLLEQPLGNVEDPLPTVTSLIRGPFGRHAWTMQLRHSPRNQKFAPKAHLTDPGRPIPRENMGTHHNVKHRYFPESVDKIPLTKADKSIPAMSSLVTESDAVELDGIKSFIDKHVAFEREVAQRVKKEREKTPYPDPRTECKQPKICHEYQTARLFLSHYGFLSLEALKEPTNSSIPPAVVMLNTCRDSGLAADLEALDTIPSRDNDTVHIFYVKSGQKEAKDVLTNMSGQTQVQPQFLEFLHSLGWPVDVRKHAGWTGHVSTSWKVSQPDSYDEDDYSMCTEGGVYDGRQQVLYWADVCSEVAFVVPSLETFKLRAAAAAELAEKKLLLLQSGDQVDGLERAASSKPKSLLLDMDKVLRTEKDSPGSPPEVPSTQRLRRTGRQPLMAGPDTKVFAVWLESFEDHEHFPTADLISVATTGQEQPIQGNSFTSATKSSDRDVHIIFIHALQNGLFRIHLHSYEKTQSKMTMAIPLVDGMVVSRRTLGMLVRQTAINVCRRKRLESEVYQPPHFRRKLKIQEITHKYKKSMSEAEFYTSLFQETT